MKQQTKVLNKYCEEVLELLSTYPPTLMEFELLWEAGEKRRAYDLAKTLISKNALATTESFDNACMAAEPALN